MKNPNNPHNCNKESNNYTCITILNNTLLIVLSTYFELKSDKPQNQDVPLIITLTRAERLIYALLFHNI